MISLPETGPVLGTCGCGALVRDGSFRDSQSEQEWQLSAYCQECQDHVFLGLDEAGKAKPSRPRFGALVAHQRFGLAVEIALIPFLIVPHSPAVAWECRYALRIGTLLPHPPGPDPLMDFVPMVRVIHSHHLRLTEIHSPDDRLLGEWFADLDLLLALDGHALYEIVRVCPALRPGLHLDLAEAIPWVDLVGRPLLPFHAFARDRGLDPVRPELLPPPSPLRMCALMGAALELEVSDQCCTPVSFLISLLRPRFPDAPRGA